MQLWEEMLDEYALRPDAMAWYQIRGLKTTIAEQFEAVQECLRRGYLQWAGVVREEWKDTLYRITPSGREYWEANIKGKRRRPKAAEALPRWTIAQMAAAQSPVSVFDLARVPWEWHKGIEECEK